MGSASQLGKIDAVTDRQRARECERGERKAQLSVRNPTEAGNAHHHRASIKPGMWRPIPGLNGFWVLCTLE